MEDTMVNRIEPVLMVVYRGAFTLRRALLTIMTGSFLLGVS